MTAKNAVPLKYGLRAHYVTHKQIAAQQRAQARTNAQRDEAQLELEEPEP
jgi:hypothetical protein